jgi:hypothetical protein
MNNEPAVMRSAKAAPKAPKVLEEIRLKRGMDGGVIATHHYEGYEHAPQPHNVEASLPAVAAHLGEHMGLEGGEKIESPKDQD